MEKVMSVEDKIKKAEEIYYRRRMGETSGRFDNRREFVREKDSELYENHLGRESINKSERNIRLLKRVIKQIIVCLIIYGIFYATVNNNYVFSEDFSNKAKEILNQDIDFKSIYSIVMSKMNELNQKLNKETEQQNENIENNETNAGNDSAIDVENNSEEQSKDNNDNGSAIGGTNEIEGDNSQIELSQMEQDANYIKSTINFIKPIDGKITSGFGIRNPTTASVPKNHTGTDIAAETGTKIVSATEGKVILASTSGDYGKHLKIQTSDNDIVVVYAHCNNLYVNEGDLIKQGQEIAEVGATGNATGPHLHFEVRYQSRYVNPQMILEL